MAATYEPIASTTLASATNSVTLSSIPATFTDLVAVFAATENASVSTGILVRFNSDTGSNYSQTNLYGTGSAAGSTRLSSETYIRPGRYVDFLGRQHGRLQIMSYANTNVYKTMLSDVINPASANGPVTRDVGLWRDTSAIDAITFVVTGAAQFAAGSTFSLFGIKAA